jgi:hypothetical protein
MTFEEREPEKSLDAMRRFFFHLAGELPAHDVLGHQCRSRREARDHAEYIAHRLAAERPAFDKPGNYISVSDENGNEIFEAPIKQRRGGTRRRNLIEASESQWAITTARRARTKTSITR